MAIFDGVRYYLSPTIPQHYSQELASILDSNAGKPVDKVEDATHVISNTDRFDGWQAVAEGAFICTPLWVERSVVLGKPQPAENYSANPVMIFSGVVACCADLCPADEEALSGTILALGGQYRAGLTRDVTHLFALSSKSDRYETALHYQSETHVSIVAPHWFDDCVLLCRRLDTAPYSWPDPQVLKPKSPSAEKDPATLMKERAAVAHVPEEKRSLFRTAAQEGKVENAHGDSVLPQYQGGDVWKGRKLLLSRSLGLSANIRGAVEAGIWRAGGTVLSYSEKNGEGTEEEELSLVESTDVFVTRYRHGWPYVKAVRGDKLVGTLAWVFHVESTGIISSPVDQLLHYPIPKRPIEGFSQHQITITNYTGEARDYLKRLIQVLGANFTPSMTSANTILLAANISGNKADRAAVWNIPVVNHTWLEDCFAQWKNITPAVGKYLHFPHSVDFAAQLGEKGIGRATLDAVRIKAELETLEKEAGPTKVTKPKSSAKRASPTKLLPDVSPAETSVFVEQEMDRPTSPAEGAGSSQLAPRQKLVRRSGSRKEAGSMFEVEGLLSGDAAPADANEDSPQVSTSRAKRSTRRGKQEEELEDDTPEPQVAAPKPKSRRKASGAAKPTSSRKEPADDARSDASAPLEILPATSSARASTINSPGKKTPTTPRRRGSDRENDAEMAGAPVTPKTPRRAYVEVPPLSASRAPPTRNESIRITADEAMPSSSKRSKPIPSPSKTRTKGKTSAADDETEDDEPLSDPPPSPVRKRPGPKKRAAARTSSPASEAADTSMAMSSQIDSNGRLRRGAAMRADNKLKSDMEDLRHFESQRRRGVITGSWEKEAEKEAKEKEKEHDHGGKKKRTSMGAETQDEEDADGDTRQTKKRKVGPSKTKKAVKVESEEEMDVEESASKAPVAKGPSKAKEYRILTSQWSMTTAQEKNMGKLGATVADSGEACTHLVMPELARTEKLLEVLPTVKYLVSPQWVTASIKAKKLLPEGDYTVPNAAAGKDKFGISAAEVMKRRDACKGRLFAGHTFFITPGVKDALVVLRTAIQANGGKVSTTQTPTVRILDGDELKHVVSCEADIKIWKPLVQQKYPIFSKEFVLISASTQKMDVEDKSQRVPGSY